MDAIVPAAGRGTRMRPLTDDRPTPLVEVAGRPLVTHAMDALRSAGADRLVVVVVEDGRVVRAVEKPADPPARPVAVACYALGPAAFDACEALDPGQGGTELTAALDRLARCGGDVRAVPFAGERVTVNRPADR